MEPIDNNANHIYEDLDVGSCMKESIIIVLVALGGLVSIPTVAADAEVDAAPFIHCNDPRVNFKPVCSDFDPQGRPTGTCFGYFMHDPLTNRPSWVFCKWD